MAVLVALGAARATAEPRLTLTREPPPRTLRMRAPRVVAEAPPPARPASPIPAPPPPLALARASYDEDGVAALRDLRRQVAFSIDLGYQVEAANPSGQATLDGRMPVVEQDFAALRSYGFGEVFGATRGLGLSSLSTYFALRFQAARPLTYAPPMAAREVPVAPPIATWFERSGLDVRYGWAELRDFLPQRWGLARLRVRAGGQHIYGPWVTHIDGALIAYDGPLVSASVYSGTRHADYTREQADTRPGVVGASLRVDLRGLATPLPIALQGDVLAIDRSREASQPAATSALLQGDWRPRRDVALIGQLRTRDGHSASQRLELRARYRQVTNLVFDVTRRTEDDWWWDPMITAPETDPTAAKRYLDLGPIVPQLVGSARAGTLIAENIDLLVRGAFATDTRGDDEPASSYAAPYLELGGALEVRLRRTIALGTSVLSRATERVAPDQPIADVAGQAQPLPASAQRGEQGFVEVGGSLRMTLGARQFSSLLEVYGRRTRFAPLYSDPTLAIPTRDFRLGGRITLDAWIGTDLRLFAAYDVSSDLAIAPEISGYRSLRLMMSGVY